MGSYVTTDTQPSYRQIFVTTIPALKTRDLENALKEKEQERESASESEAEAVKSARLCAKSRGNIA